MKKITFFLMLLCAVTLNAQTDEITYQGKLHDAGAPANGSYDMQFLLATAETGPSGELQTKGGVQVVNGVFTVTLAYPASMITGADLWLEIRVKPAGSSDPYVTLDPRQKITSAPYAIRSLNSGNADLAADSLKLGGVDSSLYVQTSDARLTDARPPTAGSGNYIQNTTVQQPSSNFNISGTGSANTFNAAEHYAIGGERVVSVAGTGNFFAGVNAGAVNTGNSNAFVGTSAGGSNTTGFRNSFYGAFAGFYNTSGANNSFFGYMAGLKNTTASGNSFFGREAGSENTTGDDNAFFGEGAGGNNTVGRTNSFFGALSGVSNIDGDFNAFFGRGSGFNNTSGRYNTFIGANSGIENVSGELNTFVGYGSGYNNSTGSRNVIAGYFAGSTITTGSDNTIIGYSAGVSSGTLTFATAIGSGAVANQSNSVFLGRPAGEDTVRIPGNLNVTGAASLNGNLVVASGGVSVFNGNVVIPTLGSAGSTNLCRNASNMIATCSSSLRYKTDISSYFSGLDLIRRLRPIAFEWKDGGVADLGLGAEDVAKIEPLLVHFDKAGNVEGVKYDRIGVVLVNAVKEQQEQITSLRTTIERQEAQIEKQNAMIESLKQLVCAGNADSAVCRENKNE